MGTLRYIGLVLGRILLILAFLAIGIGLWAIVWLIAKGLYSSW